MLERVARSVEALARRAVARPPFPQPPLRPTRYPVVLMHGFGAMANLKPGGVLHAEAMHLRGHGIRAYAPQVNPYDTVAVRAAAWRERVARVRAETGAEKVSLVAFSSGGLDARHLAGPMGYAPHLAALVTVSTPHRGSALAAYLLERPARLQRALLGLMAFFGRAAFADAPPRVREALEEMTPAYVEGTFAPAHPIEALEAAGVYCASYAGRAGQGTDVGIYPPLLLANRILYRLGGLNDGYVPVGSARWGHFLGTIDADHARQIGVRLTPSAFDSRAFVLSVAEHLRARGL